MIVALVMAALILALVEEFMAPRGRSLVGWAVVLIAIALLVTEGVFPRI